MGPDTQSEDEADKYPDFLMLGKMRGEDLVQVVYVLGAAFLTLGAVALVIWSYANGLPWWVSVSGVLWVIFGNLLWRLQCELCRLFFSMHTQLTSIDKALKGSRPKRPAVPE